MDMKWFLSDGPLLTCNNASGTIMEVEDCNASGVFPGEDEDCNITNVLRRSEDPRTDVLRHYSYGVALPIICCFGIVGNVLNLVVLTRRNMNGTAYIYMRGYSAAALLAILFAIPFGLRVLVHQETGRWTNMLQGFYHAHLELFLGNACLGVGVMMLLILTVERYVSVCQLGKRRPLMGPPHLIVALIPLFTFLVYLPTVFRSELRRCALSGGTYIYYKRGNALFQRSTFYAVYKVLLEILFKVGPTILLAVLNLRITIVYRQTCERRRGMTLSRMTSSEGGDPRKYAEEQRLILLLGSSSILFLVCVSPMVILNVTLSEQNLNQYSYQVFRAIANLLEVINYSITFYIYCFFSEDFRNTLFSTFRWPWVADKKSCPGTKAAMDKKLLACKPSSPPTTTTTTNNVTGASACLPVASSSTAHKLWQRLSGCTGSKDRCSYSQAEKASV